MDEKDKILETLKTEKNVEAIKTLIQDLGQELLLFDVVVGDKTIEPLWIEAYFRKDHVFEIDDAIHGNDTQSKMNVLYKHKKGRGGVDICFGCSDYKLSFLLKGTIIKGEAKKQIETMKIIAKNQNEIPFTLKRSTKRDKNKIGKTVRIFSKKKKDASEDFYSLEFAFFYCEDESRRKKISSKRTNNYYVFSYFMKAY